jgi:hypothetical protein
MAAIGNSPLVDFRTPPTVGRFMLDDSFCRLIMGPVGSGKSAGCFMELLRRARLQEPDSQGVRRTRFAIVRNTLQQLRQTCLADIQLWLSSICRYRVTDATVQIRLDLSDGTKVESDWMLIPLDTKQDQQRLLSLNLTGAWVSEFREIDLSIIDALAGRLGRYPSKAISKPSWYGIIAESNPPDEDSEWYTKLEIAMPPNWKLFKQPGGLEKTAENLPNLPEKYYENLEANNNADWVDVHVHANYGKSLSGQAVFRATFRPDFHVTYEDIESIPGMPVMIGQDFGRTPCALIGQIDNVGRLVIFREVTSEDMGIEKFCTHSLRPILYQHYQGKEIFLVGDPSGKFKGQISEESPFDALIRLGFKIYGAPTNDIEPRLRSVEQLLLHQIDGGPMLLINGTHCPQLVQAMKFWYRYRRKQTGVLDDKPEKNHPWSDLADCLQYMALSTNGNYIGKLISRSRAKPRGPGFSKAAWT